MTIISSQRTIGNIVYVDSTNANILLKSELKGSLYADAGTLTLISQVGGYILFPSGVGEYIVGILTSAYEKEEPDFKKKADGAFTLHLAESKRTLKTNLLGTLISKDNNQFIFKKGISVYPALGSEALIPSNGQINAILNYQIENDKEDLSIPVGTSPIYPGTKINLSLQNLFAFCLGIIGNTGSGKSYTVASLIQSVVKALEDEAKRTPNPLKGGNQRENPKEVPSSGDLGVEQPQTQQAKPKFIILDINGEYSKAFKKTQPEREVNHAYLNGEDFKLPLWAFENDEICKFFRASPQVQTPTLERLVDNLRKGDIKLSYDERTYVINQKIEKLRDIATSESYKGARKQFKYEFENCAKYAKSQNSSTFSKLTSNDDFKQIEKTIKTFKCIFNFREERELDIHYYDDSLSLDVDIRTHFENLYNFWKVNNLQDINSKEAPDEFREKYFRIEKLNESTNWRTVFKTNQDEDDSFENSKTHENTSGLRMRIRKFLSEPRYQVFMHDENLDALLDKVNKTLKEQKEKKTIYEILVDRIVSTDEAITVIDCSMLNKEVLPFFCAVIGRILLSERENRAIEKRDEQPWCLVLEEAHNYVRPYREGEGNELKLCRQVFERIAKEGRKFGLSLVVASQRPSEISETILSQCANFIVHRLQNPDDIDYFKRILPSGSREILDQVSILKSGETLIMGTASNVPSKVQITKPYPEPHSESPNLYQNWITK